MRLALAFIFAVLLAGSFTAVAQEEDVKPPELTEVQKLRIRVLTQRLEIAQLRSQMAQRDFDTAKTELTQLMQSLTVGDYTLDLETMTYTRNPEK